MNDPDHALLYLALALGMIALVKDEERSLSSFFCMLLALLWIGHSIYFAAKWML